MFRRGLVDVLHRDGVLVAPRFEFDQMRAGHLRPLGQAELLRRVAQCTFAEEGVAAPLLRGSDHLSVHRCGRVRRLLERALTGTAVAYCCERDLLSVS